MEARSTRIDPGHEIIVVIDTLVGGVHFPVDTGPEDIGYKALAVNLSDMAAMGGMPLAADVSVTRETTDPAWLSALLAGLGELAARHRVALGPPLERTGPTCVSVALIGQVPRGKALLRAGAKPGDGIYVTGCLGDAGLALIVRGPGEGLPEAERAYLEARLARPEPRIPAGLALRDLASAAIDVSDGLAADLGHILAASEVGAVLDPARLPLSPVLGAAVSRRQALALALSAGDDYELCFTVAPDRAAELASRLVHMACPVTHIGTVHADPGLRVVDTDGHVLDAPDGYRHFP